MHQMILLRHGQSQWNLENRFTGWTDVDSTAQYAMLGRAIAFAITVVVVWYPIASYRQKPTRMRMAVAIVICLLVAAALATYLLLLIALDQAWRD